MSIRFVAPETELVSGLQAGGLDARGGCQSSMSVRRV